MKRRGLGLVAMRERADLLGGTLAFLRPEEGGTLVRLTVPIAVDDQASVVPNLMGSDPVVKS
jgi:nitrate/nitrite-specific signal transduction histidine kinase